MRYDDETQGLSLRDQIRPRRTLDPDQVKRVYSPEAVIEAGYLLQELLDQDVIDPDEKVSLENALREATRTIQTKGLSRRKFFKRVRNYTVGVVGLGLGIGGAYTGYDYQWGQTGQARRAEEYAAAELARLNALEEDRKRRALLESTNTLGIEQSTPTLFGWTVRHGLSTEQFSPTPAVSAPLVEGQQIQFSAGRIDKIEQTGMIIGYHPRSVDDTLVPTLGIASEIKTVDANGVPSVVIAERWIVMPGVSDQANKDVLVFENGTMQRAFGLQQTRSELPTKAGYVLRALNIR